MNWESQMTSADKARSADLKEEAEATASRIGATMHRAKEEIAQSAASARGEMSDDLRKLSDDVASLRDTVAKLAKAVASEVGSAAKEIGEDIVEEVEDEASTLVSEFEKVARKNPLAVVGGALCLGLIIGMMRGRG
jgi:ElaB/YqjD/DUF883 family membrane-anchored ribosome-binding protein